MAAKKKKIWKSIPLLTRSEKANAEYIETSFKNNEDPLTVHIQSVGGSHKLTSRNIADYYEWKKIPFACDISCFNLVKGDKGYERQVL